MGCFDCCCLDYHFDRHAIRDVSEPRGCCNLYAFILWRVLIGLFSGALGILGLIALDALTSWGLVWQGFWAVFAAVSSILSLRARLNPDIDHDQRGVISLENSRFHRWTMQLGEVSIATGFSILCNYWGWLGNDGFDFLDFTVHGLPFVLAAIDFSFSGLRFEINHIWDSLLFMALYLALNAYIVLVDNGGEPIYEPLTWTDGTSVAIVCTVMGAQALGFLGFWYLSKYKKPNVSEEFRMNQLDEAAI